MSDPTNIKPAPTGGTGWTIVVLGVLALIVYGLFTGCSAIWHHLNEPDPWCVQMQEFYGDNPGDSNPQLARAYEFQCSN